MPTHYEAKGAWWSSERDDWEDGCTGPSGDGYEAVTLTGETAAEVLTAIRDFVGAYPDGDPELVVNACDETGRVDACGTTTDLDDARSWATEREVSEWKMGNRDCYYTIWTFHVERVTREAVDLEHAAVKA